MKKIIVLACFMLFAVNAIAEERTLDGFWGIKFGTSKTEAKKAMIAKGGKLRKGLPSTKYDQLCFTNLKFGGRDTIVICLYFDNNLLYEAGVVLAAPLEAKTLSLYDEIKAEINDKYYVSAKDYKFFNYPFEEGDGHELTAIGIGKADIATFWEFSPEDEPNRITLNITSGLFIHTEYSHGKMGKAVQEKLKAKNLKDY